MEQPAIALLLADITNLMKFLYYYKQNTSWARFIWMVYQLERKLPDSFSVMDSHFGITSKRDKNIYFFLNQKLTNILPRRDPSNFG
jgi:hypothetical protein